MFRSYDDYGYITDNAMFGYRMLNDKSYYPGEEYVSESGAIMLGMLSKQVAQIHTVLVTV